MWCGCQLAHQVGTFFGCADNLHTGGILQVIHTRDCPITWIASLYRIRLTFGRVSKSHGNTVDVEHCFSSTDRRPIGADHTGFRGHAAGMRLRSQGWLEEHFPLLEFTYNKSYQASIQMAPYEDLYGRPCRSSIC